MTEMERIELNVTVNGTDTNPWHRFGLRQNPFPQTGKAEYAAGERQLASLDGDPVRTSDDIRERLAGFDPKFVEGVIRRWQPGRRVSFKVMFPSRRNTAELSGDPAVPARPGAECGSRSPARPSGTEGEPA